MNIPKRILVVDVGGSHVKFRIGPDGEIDRFDSGPDWTAKQMADGYPDPKTGECTQISTAFTIEALPAFVLHQPGDTGAKKTAQADSAGHQE